MSIETRLLDAAREIVTVDPTITAKTHHETIKRYFRSAMQDPTAGGATVAEMRQALTDVRALIEQEQAEQAERAAWVIAAEKQGKAPKAKSAKPKAEKVEREWKPTPTQALHWGKVVMVTEFGSKNQPKRVVIACQLPGCKHTREIATQDLFQVSHCSVAHKRQHAKLLAAE